MLEDSYLSATQMPFQIQCHNIFLQNKLMTIIFLIAGSSTYQICCKIFAPSTIAASSRSLLAFDSAAVYMIDAHPAVCQIPLAI